MSYTDAQLTEAERQIESTLHKLRQVVKTLEAKSQLTLARRRIEAFTIAVDLIRREQGKVE